MPVKKCPKCAAVWYTDLLKCAFCGIEGVEQVQSESVAHVMDRGKTAPKEPEPAPAPPPVVEAPPPPPPPPPPPEPKPAPEPEPKAEPAPVPKPEPKPVPPAPLLPSASVPLVFGLLGLGAAAILPLSAVVAWSRVAYGLLLLAAAVLLPFAPFAWWTGLHYERRCAELGFRPAPSGRLGRLCGLLVTLLLAAEGSALLFLAALRRLQGP